MKVLWTGLLILLFANPACAGAREDYARQIVDSLKIDEMFAAQYAIWDGYEQQILRTQVEQTHAPKDQVDKELLQLSNSLPQHDVHFANRYKQALQATLLKNYGEEELRYMSQRFNSPSAQKIIGLITDLDKQFVEEQAKAAAQRITGTAPAPALTPQ